MSATETLTHPIIRARDDDGHGLSLNISDMSGKTILEAEGAYVIESDKGETLMLSVRSDRRDFE